MNTLREAAQQALKALEQCGLDDTHRSYELEHAARTALRAALAQHEQAEPDGPVVRRFKCTDCGHVQEVRGVRASGGVYLGSGANWCDKCEGLPKPVEAAHGITGEQK
jgi:hypothetical protein